MAPFEDRDQEKNSPQRLRRIVIRRSGTGCDIKRTGSEAFRTDGKNLPIAQILRQRIPELPSDRPLFSGRWSDPPSANGTAAGSVPLPQDPEQGHWKLPCSRRLYKSSQPSPSQTRPLNRSVRLPQKIYRVSGTNGLWPRLLPIKETRRSIPDLRSVYPVTI